MSAELVRYHEAAALLEVSRQNLQRMVRIGTVPEPTRDGRRKLFVREQILYVKDRPAKFRRAYVQSLKAGV